MIDEIYGKIFFESGYFLDKTPQKRYNKFQYSLFLGLFMRKLQLFVSFLLICLTSINAFSQEEDSYEELFITPLTEDLVNIIQNSGKNLKDLTFYVSVPFKMLVNEQYDPPRVDIQDGALITPDKGQGQTFDFTYNQQGRLHGFPVSGSKDIFEVIFPVDGKDIALKFKKNKKGNFELYSALIDTRPYTLHSNTELARLAISSNITAGSAGSGRNNLLEGRGSLDKSKIIAYVKSKNPSVNETFLDSLINTYIQESALENINHDIAIAQMLYATSFLSGGKFVSSNNYGGLLELPTWNGVFADMAEGVRAHIQHIKGYASTTMNNRQIVDPRYYLLVNLGYLGTVKSVDQLCDRWSTASNGFYKNSIKSILDGLYL
jgi:hypothetical protein